MKGVRAKILQGESSSGKEEAFRVCSSQRRQVLLPAGSAAAKEAPSTVIPRNITALGPTCHPDAWCDQALPGPRQLSYPHIAAVPRPFCL